MKRLLLAALGLSLLMIEPPRNAFASTASDKTIAEVAADAGIFAKLLAAAKGAGLDDDLAGTGPLTLFAPSDTAFEALPEGTIETLLEPKNRDRLAEVISYHIVPGILTSSDLGGYKRSLETLAGRKITIDAKGDELQIGTAKVISADVRASNGVIHIIDRVMLPAM